MLQEGASFQGFPFFLGCSFFQGQCKLCYRVPVPEGRSSERLLQETEPLNGSDSLINCWGVLIMSLGLWERCPLCT